jgi:hypothetical protein
MGRDSLVLGIGIFLVGFLPLIYSRSQIVSELALVNSGEILEAVSVALRETVVL